MLLVSVICLCYNHAPFVEEAVFSALTQTYRNLEIIIVDDASTDSSVEIIHTIVSENPLVKFIANPHNIGNCKSFNNAFKICKGDLIIDFATDDVMLPDRIAIQVEAFSKLNTAFGVVYSNSEYIDESAKYLGLHSKKYPYQPSGDIYIALLKRYFICPPTMMYRRWLVEQLGGYNENLAYEDFDFWVQSSRICKYQYIENITTKKRIVKKSLGSKFSEKNNPIHFSTYQVCQIAFRLNNNMEEHQALAQRILSEIKLCYLTQNFEMVSNYAKLYYKLPAISTLQNIKVRAYQYLSAKKIGVFWLYKWLKN